MSPSPSPALAALRDATRDLHAELDRRSPLGDDDLDDRAYLDHAGRILGWLEPLERALRDNRSGWPAALRADARLVKSAWLESDLLAGGMSRAQVEALPRCADLPNATRAAEVFGVAYVMEGATLGGAYLYKRLAPRLPGLPLQWLRATARQPGCAGRSFSNSSPGRSTAPKPSALRRMRHRLHSFRFVDGFSTKPDCLETRLDDR